MFRFLISMSVALALLTAASAASAQDATAPDELVRQTTEKVLATLEEHKAEIEKDPTKVFGYVRDLVLPNFDFELMSRLVLARNWRSASEQQKRDFTDEFRRLLIRTYGKSLAEYSGQEVEFPPMRSDPSNDRVTVASEIQQDNGAAIPLNYQLYRTDKGWKVFDVSIGGVSLVQNYRSSFASELRNRDLDALIDKLAERNAQQGLAPR